MNEQRMKEVLAEEGFVEGLLQMQEPEEVIAALGAKGLTISHDEVMALRDMLVKILEKVAESGGELSFEDLDEVAGGAYIAAAAWLPQLAYNVASAAVPTLVASVASAAVAAVSITAIFRRW